MLNNFQMMLGIPQNPVCSLCKYLKAGSGSSPPRWTDVFGSERLTHHVHIVEMNGDSYRLRHSQENADSQVPDDPDEE